MAQILAYLPKTTHRARLSGALRLAEAMGSNHVLDYADGPALLTAQLRATAPAVVVFDPCADTSLSAATWVELAYRFPSSAFLAIVDASDLASPECSVVIHGGTTVHAIGGNDSRVALLERLEHGFARSAAKLFAESMQTRIHPNLFMLLRRLLDAAVRPITAGEAAALCFTSERTLRRRLATAGFPSLNRLIVLLRLYHAARLLADRGRTVENVAGVLQFPSANALRNQTRRHVGLSLQGMRQDDAAATVLGQIVAPFGCTGVIKLTGDV